ncbi:MAG: pilus assembly protein PilM, partial [Usitatibacter sp.]
MSMAANSDIVASRPAPAWQQKLATFWRWWTGELAAMVPDRFARGSRVPVLSIENDEVVLLEPKSAAGPAARVPTAALEAAQARTAVRGVLERAGETRARARLCLSRDEALVRRVSMPAATEENLAQVIGFEMDRLTPFRAEEVYFDQRVLSRDPAAGQVEVQLAVARRDLVDARVARLRELGVSVQGVTVRDDPGQGSGALDLLPTGQRGERESANERLAKLVLMAVVAVLLFVALVLPAWQKRESIIALHPTIAKAKQEAEATDALARTLERQVADYNFVQGKRHGPPALAYLEDVSRLL